MRLLLRAYPRAWRERYGDELLALLEAEPLTWRARLNVVTAGLGERLHASGPPQIRMLWAWALFVVGGMAFQKTSEHWQVVVPNGRAVPTAAFDTVQVAATIGSAAVVLGVALALPAFVRDLRSGGWDVLRRPLIFAAAVTVVACGSLVALSQSHDAGSAAVFVVSAFCSLFGWTHTATAAARRLAPQRAHTYLAGLVGATMLVMTVAAAAWFGAVTAHAPSFVGAAQLAVTSAFMLGGLAVAAAGTRIVRA